MRTHRITGGGGVQLHVVEAGNPRGRPILFIHGFSQCWLQWNRQMNSSLVDDHRLVALDLRGHGRSDKPRDGYDDSKQWADDVNAVIQTLDLDRPVSPAGPTVRSSCSTTSGITVRTDWEGSISSAQSRSSVARRPFRPLRPSYSALSRSFVPRTQSRVSAVWRAWCGYFLSRSPRLPSFTSRSATTSLCLHMSDRRCSRGQSTTTTFCRSSASPC